MSKNMLSGMKMEQKYILKNSKSFRAKDVFECGQCFRFYKLDKEEYVIVKQSDILAIVE